MMLKILKFLELKLEFSLQYIYIIYIYISDNFQKVLERMGEHLGNLALQLQELSEGT